MIEWTGKILRDRPNFMPALGYRAASFGLRAAWTRAGKWLDRFSNWCGVPSKNYIRQY